MWSQHTKGLEIGLHPGRSPFQKKLGSLLCIHGAGGEGMVYRTQLSGLGRDMNIAALDLPGHGKTPAPSYELISDYASWLADVISCGPVRPVVLGHSMGGAIAMTLAVNHPGLVRGLVLSSTGSRLPVSEKLMREFQDDFPAAVEHMIHLAYAPGTARFLLDQGKHQLLQVPPKVILGDFIACDRFDLSKRLHEIKVPTLLICGSRDRMTPLEYTLALSKAIPGAKLEIIEGAGHIINLEAPSAFNQAIKDFMAGLPHTANQPAA
jgi:pimeloyl-ACP methyl ester carboxylesterase